MDYFERLICRALAVPQRDGQPLFDPFEQIAPWTMIPPPARGDTQPVVEEVPFPAPLIPLRPPVPTESTTAPTPPIEAVVAVSPPQVPFHASPPLDSAPIVAAAVEAILLKPAPTERRHPAASETTPLARADAFMRQIGAPPSHLTLTAASPIPVSKSIPARNRSATTELAVSPPAHSPRSTPAATVQIMPERTVAPPTTLLRERQTASRTAPAAVEAEDPRAVHPHSVPQRIVQTMVVVARHGSRPLDELAHSSGISRFGVGQW